MKQRANITVTALKILRIITDKRRSVKSNLGNHSNLSFQRIICGQTPMNGCHAARKTIAMGVTRARSQLFASFLVV
jgi:hypothetical protein